MNVDDCLVVCIRTNVEPLNVWMVHIAKKGEEEIFVYITRRDVSFNDYMFALEPSARFKLFIRPRLFLLSHCGYVNSILVR